MQTRQVVVIVNGAQHPVTSARTAQMIVWLIEHSEYVNDIDKGQVVLNLAPKSLTSVTAQRKFDIVAA